MSAGFTWRAYTDGSPLSGALDWEQGDPGVSTLDELYGALDAGTLPNVAFVDGLDNVEDDHPLADLQRGEAWVKTIYDHAVKSPQWDRLAIIWTYDEAGAFADHVPPPMGCLATPSTAPFVELGPRIPLVVISPWAQRNYASHVVHDHTAITRFIEAVFDLPALTARDANSDALMDMFDFTCDRDLSVQPPPAPGTGGCPNPPPAGAD
jgi:phospholipase C